MFGKNKKQSAPVPRRRRISDDELGFSPAVAPTQPTEQPAGQFRRNQTLSSYRHNTPEESSRQKAHTLAKQRRRLGGIFAIVAIAVVLLLLLLWQLIAQVNIRTSTKQLTQQFVAAPYEKIIDEYLGVNPAQRLRVALDETSLSQYVSSQLPEVEKLELTGSAGLAESNFSITFRTPVAGWQINGRQYYVDSSGVVFEKNYYQDPTVQIVDESGITPEQGVAVAGTRLLGFLGRIVAGAGERGYVVNRAVLPAETTREVDIFVEGKSTRLKFSIDRGAGEQVEDADRTLTFLSGRGVMPEYIDVRVAGRAAYR
jgi:hypothetical protein